MKSSALAHVPPHRAPVEPERDAGGGIGEGRRGEEIQQRGCRKQGQGGLLVRRRASGPGGAGAGAAAAKRRILECFGPFSPLALFDVRSPRFPISEAAIYTTSVEAFEGGTEVCIGFG